MPNIQDCLKDILTAVKGKDVRQSIHDGIKQCYYDGKAGAIDLEARQILSTKADEADLEVERQRITNLSTLPSGSTTGDAELMDIRTGYDGKNYTNAGEAVRGQVSQLSNEIVEVMQFNGSTNLSYKEWGTLEKNKYYMIPNGTEFPEIFRKYGVTNGILEIFQGVANGAYSAMYRFTSGFMDKCFVARFDPDDSGDTVDWVLSWAEGRQANSLLNIDYSSLRYVGECLTSFDECTNVGVYNVPTNSPAILSDEKINAMSGMKNGTLYVMCGSCNSGNAITQFFVSGLGEYMFYRLGSVVNGENLHYYFSDWIAMITPTVVGLGKLETDNVYYALGDSITAGSYSEEDGSAHAVTNASWAWCKQISDHIGCTLQNLGIPGATTQSILTNEVPKVGEDATIITIMAGTNDYFTNVPIGTYEDTTTGTTCGNLYNIIAELMGKVPKARLIVLSPLNAKRSDSSIDTNYSRGQNNEAGWSLDDLCEEYKKLCAKYGIEFINMTSESPVNSFNITAMLGDGVHPKKDTYDSVAQYVYSKMF